MSNENDGMNGDPYAVGYKKPPKATQFKTGNNAQKGVKAKLPKGKLPPAGSVEEIFAQAFLQPVTVKKVIRPQHYLMS